MAQSDAQQAGDERRRTALRHGSRSPRLSCKGSQVRTKVRASGRHMATYDSCLVTLTGLVLRVLPRLAHSSLRVRTRATYACLASTYWLSITLGALLSADTPGSHFYGRNTAREPRSQRRAWESALCFTAVSQAQRRRACVCRTRRGLRARVRAQASSSAPPGACGPCCAVKFVMCAACPLSVSPGVRVCRMSAPARLWVWPGLALAQRHRTEHRAVSRVCRETPTDSRSPAARSTRGTVRSHCGHSRHESQ